MNKNSLKQFKVENFRNLQPSLLTFSKDINVIIGNNGNGKTNLLEAIYYLFQGKSFRKKNSFPQMLSTDCVKGEIIFNATFKKGNIENYISGKQLSSGGTFFLNNKKVSRNKLKMVFISPHDAFLFFNDSTFRKDKINSLFGLLDSEFKKLSGSYGKYLKHKSAMLKGKVDFDKKLLQIYNEELARLTKVLTIKKSELIEIVNPFLERIFENIFGEKLSLSLNLKSKFVGLKSEEILDLFSKDLQKETILKTTLSGQHKDDYEVFLEGFLAQEYGSLGQLKMSYFSILFAFIKVLYCKINESPIVLIDDVSGELDHIRLKQLLLFLENLESQVFLTSANNELFLGDEKVKIINVSDGVFS